jgi:HK97 gp10 family phage protein
VYGCFGGGLQRTANSEIAEADGATKEWPLLKSFEACMSDEFVSIDGLEELADAMEQLPSRVAKAAARPALNAAGQVFQAAILATVPRDTGALANSIGRKVSVKGDLETMSVIVGPKYMGGGEQDPGVRGMFLELGTRKMAPRFFMRKAFESSKEAATAAAVAVLRAVIGALPK